MTQVILTEDHRGLGKKGSVYECPNDEVANKLIRLGRARGEFSEEPQVLEAVPEVSETPEVEPEVPVVEDVVPALPGKSKDKGKGKKGKGK